MKQALLIGAVFFLHLQIAAQCSDCYTLKEALKDPKNVRHLNLSNQGLTQLPDSVRFMTNLESIDLSENFITVLDLKGAQLDRVYKLDLSGNIGLDALHFGKIAEAFPNLLNLDVSSCRLAYLTPAIEQFQQLLSLDVSHNDLQYIPEELKNMPLLDALNIRGNRIADITYVLSNCWNLRSLNAADNPFDPDALLISIGMSNKLDHLSYSYSQPGREGAKALAELPVRSLELIGAVDTDLSPALASNPTISHLTLTDCYFTSDVSPVLDGLSGLKKLTLNHTQLPEKLTKVTKLSSLELANMPYPSNRTLGKLDFLDELDLTQVDVSDSGTNELPALLPKTTVRTSYFDYSPEMTDNSVTAIVAEPAVEQTIAGDKPVEVVVDGITFDVPKDAFLNADGSVYTGDVTLKITNYDNAITNALSGAPMIFDNNGKSEVFASSGMLDFRATDTKGNELQPNPDNIIQVTMPNQQPANNANLYAFDPGTKQWKQSWTSPFAINSDSTRNQMIDSINKLDLSKFVNFQTIPTLFALKIRDKNWDATQLSFTFYNRPYGFNATSASTIRYYDMDLDSRVIGRNKWRIDTLMTPELTAKLMEIQCGLKVGKNVKSSKRYDNQPRPIQELKVTPDFANDNYRMTFRYKDTLISLPVALETKRPNGRGAMMGYAKFQKAMERAARKDQRADKQHEKQKKALIEKFGPGARQAVINSIVVNGMAETQEQLRFGLTNFGLVNCDFFYRNQPDGYGQLTEVLSDQNGDTLRAPEFVRMILPQSNVYLTSGRESIPQYTSQKAILLLLISATEIGIIKLDQLKEKIGSFKRVNIAGKSSEEVSNIINNE